MARSVRRRQRPIFKSSRAKKQRPPSSEEVNSLAAELAAPATPQFSTLLLVGYPNGDAPRLWHSIWQATQLWAPGRPVDDGRALQVAQFGARLDIPPFARVGSAYQTVADILDKLPTGFVLCDTSQPFLVSRYLREAQRTIKVLFIEQSGNDPRLPAEPTMRDVRHCWQPVANATLHIDQIHEQPEIIWDTLETMGYRVNRIALLFSRRTAAT